MASKPGISCHCSLKIHLLANLAITCQVGQVGHIQDQKYECTVFGPGQRLVGKEYCKVSSILYWVELSDRQTCTIHCNRVAKVAVI